MLRAAAAAATSAAARTRARPPAVVAAVGLHVEAAAAGAAELVHVCSKPPDLPLSSRYFSPSREAASVAVAALVSRYRCHCSSGCLPLSPSEALTLRMRSYSTTTITAASSSNDNNEDVTITQTPAAATTSTSSESSSSTEDPPLPPQKAEERLLELKTHLRTHYKHAAYHEALQTSNDVLEACLVLYGESHPATASAYNDVGLMHKMLGQFDESRTNYQRSLQLYGDTVGTDHGSYASALNNLGNLDRAQSTMDESLSVEQRLELNESAVRYFDDALAVRLVELGDDHPQTVTSKTNLGGALAAVVLQRHAAAAEKAKETNSSVADDGPGEGKDSDNNDGNGDSTVESASALDDGRGWEAAEEHLRSALNTATANPRGKKAVVSAHNAFIDAEKESRKKRGDKPKSKRQNARAAKMAKKQRQRESMTKHIQETMATEPVGDGIQTLSAASAAQNLAVFLKSRADVIGAAVEAGVVIPPHMDRNDMYAESRRLYESALQVRSELRGKHHPDVVTTKFSLAELLATTGDEDGANVLRSEILETYDVTEKDVEEVKDATEK